MQSLIIVNNHFRVVFCILHSVDAIASSPSVNCPSVLYIYIDCHCTLCGCSVSHRTPLYTYLKVYTEHMQTIAEIIHSTISVLSSIVRGYNYCILTYPLLSIDWIDECRWISCGWGVLWVWRAGKSSLSSPSVSSLTKANTPSKGNQLSSSVYTINTTDYGGWSTVCRSGFCPSTCLNSTFNTINQQINVRAAASNHRSEFRVKRKGAERRRERERFCLNENVVKCLDFSQHHWRGPMSYFPIRSELNVAREKGRGVRMEI